MGGQQGDGSVDGRIKMWMNQIVDKWLSKGGGGGGSIKGGIHSRMDDGLDAEVDHSVDGSWTGCRGGSLSRWIMDWMQGCITQWMDHGVDACEHVRLVKLLNNC